MFWNFRRTSMVTQIISIFLLFNIISLALVTCYIIQFEVRINENQMDESLQAIIHEKTQVVSLTMKGIDNEAYGLARIVRDALAGTKGAELSADYGRDADGILGKLSPDVDQDSNIYLPANISVSQQIKDAVAATEKVVPAANDILARNECIQWIYVITEDGLMRLMPYEDNRVFAPEHDQRNDVFFRLARPQNNPDRRTIWTQPYYDYLGTGWMVTCSTPIYDGDRFLGVLCADVRLDVIKNEMLADFRLGNTGFAFLISKSGDIIYHPGYIPDSSSQGDSIKQKIQDNRQGEGYNRIINAMLHDGSGIGTYRNPADGSQRFIAYGPIPDLGWSLGIEIDKADASALNQLSLTNILIFILIMVGVTILLAVYFVRYYSNPMFLMIEKVKKISEGDFALVENTSHFTEMNMLSESFNAMSEKLKRYTEHLLYKTQQMEAVFNSIGGCLIIVDSKYRIKIINRKGGLKFWRENRDAVGACCYEALAGQEKPCIGCRLGEVFETGKPSYCQIARRDNIYNNAYYPVWSEDARVDEVVVYSHSITKRIMMEKELLQAEKMAGIGQLSSAIAHELKTPLATIKGAAYVLKAYTRGSENPLIEENLNIVDSNVDNAENVIYSLLDFSRISNKSCERIDVTKIAEQILLLERKKLIRCNIDVAMLFSPDPLVVAGNQEAIKHILQNLIGNSIDALEKGGMLTIRGSILPGGKSCRIAVEDDGPGVPFPEQENIFKPFYSTKEGAESAGLGLWITKTIIERNQGDIRLESEPGKGASFTVTLPVRQEGMNDDVQ